MIEGKDIVISHTKGSHKFILPDELVSLVFHFLSPKDISHTSLVCKHWNKLSSESTLWKYLYVQNSWTIDLGENPKSPKIGRWKEKYKGSHLVEKHLQDVFEAKHFETFKFVGHSSPVLCIDFIDDDYLVTSGADKQLRIWSLASNSGVYTIKNSHTSAVCALSMTKINQSTERLLISGDGDGIVKIWPNMKLLDDMALITMDFQIDFVSRPTATLPINLGIGIQAHRGFISGLEFSHDNRHFCTAGADSKIGFWDTHTISNINEFENHESPILCMTHKKDIVASGDSTRQIKLTDIRSGDVVAKLEGHNQQISSLDMDINRTVLVSGGWDNSIVVWDLRKMEQLNSWKSTLQSDGTDNAEPDTKIMTLQIDAKRIIVGNNIGQLRVWDIQNHTLVSDICNEDGALRCLKFNEKRLATGNYNNVVSVYSYPYDESDENRCIVS